MNIPETYSYLTRARRDLWAALEATPDEVLSRPVLSGSRFHSIKDLVLHIPAVEDSWIHEDLLADAPVWERVPAIQGAEDGPVYAAFPLEALLDYWRQVEASTQTYLGRLTPAELAREVVVNGSEGEERFTVDGLLWHVLIHEMRHTAQIAVLLRQAGIKPPFLDLLNYLPVTQK
ncbi:DinB family protein [Deinococcus frigens]|uniref:DinB family protein n=1 Tax=Deinococcus frigens TaxID=249403 RepID=UPI0005511807|nr:DinB family protein [Deinococcus frigens]